MNLMHKHEEDLSLDPTGAEAHSSSGGGNRKIPQGLLSSSSSLVGGLLVS